MTILDCVQIDIPHPVFLRTSFVTLPLVRSQTSHPVPFCFRHSPLQPFLCWFLLGIYPEVVFNSFHTSGLVLSSLPISGRTSGFSFHASDMVLDKFLQFRISRPDFPTLSGSPLGSSIRVTLPLEVQLNFIGCPLDFIPKCGAHTQVRGTAYELRPSPSFLIRPSGMVLNSWVVRVSPQDISRFHGPRPVRNHFLKGLLSEDSTVATDLADKPANFLAQLYRLPNFPNQLRSFIEFVNGSESHFQNRLLKVWYKFCLQLHSDLRPCLVMPSQQVQAYPPSEAYPLGNCDVVLLRTQNDEQVVVAQ
ncbi:hypothetical protein EDD22DRAFT_854669, partial [Suillus occidentalis]